MKGGVRKRGKKWYYYFDAASIDGKRKKIERVGGLTKKETETALRKAINEYENCGTVKTESSISVADYFNFGMMTMLKLIVSIIHKLDMLIQSKIISFLNSEFIN